jgi:predicted DNA-binding transcriptional regulator AlpA
MNEKLDLVGLAEIARIVGSSRAAVKMMRVRGKLPPPITELACGPIWHRKTIEEWAANRAAKFAA